MRVQAGLTMAIALTALLAGCGGPDAPARTAVSVDQASVRLNANPAAPAAGYFTLHGAAGPLALVEITSGDAARVEMHETRMDNGLMRMMKMDEVPVPAGGTVRFAPGGKHAMLWTIDPQAIAAGRVRLTFHFSDGAQVEAQAAIEPGGGADTGMSGNMAMPANAMPANDAGEAHHGH